MSRKRPKGLQTSLQHDTRTPETKIGPSMNRRADEAEENWPSAAHVEWLTQTRASLRPLRAVATRPEGLACRWRARQRQHHRRREGSRREKLFFFTADQTRPVLEAQEWMDRGTGSRQDGTNPSIHFHDAISLGTSNLCFLYVKVYRAPRKPVGRGGARRVQSVDRSATSPSPLRPPAWAA